MRHKNLHVPFFKFVRFNLKHYLKECLPPGISLLLLIIIGEIISCLFAVPVYVMPAPHNILQELVVYRKLLLFHSSVTMTEAVLGFLLGSCTGMLLGGGFAYSRRLEQSLLPLIIAINAIPVIAIAPIIILWFGYGMLSKVVVAAFLCFFPISINMLKGMKAVKPGMLDLFQIYNASEWKIFWKCRFPSALPYIFTGLKLNATYSVIGAIVAEFVGAGSGLGFAIVQAAYVVNTPRLWAAIILSALFGLVFFKIIGLLEYLLIPWVHKEPEVPL